MVKVKRVVGFEWSSRVLEVALRTFIFLSQLLLFN